MKRILQITRALGILFLVAAILGAGPVKPFPRSSPTPRPTPGPTPVIETGTLVPLQT